MPSENHDAAKYAPDKVKTDFPETGTVWRWFSVDRFRAIQQWEVIGFLQGQHGPEVISRLVRDKLTIASHPLELMMFEFSEVWRDDDDLEVIRTRLEEFTDRYPHYDFVVSTLGWVQIPGGYIAYSPDKVIWGLGESAAEALADGRTHIEDFYDIQSDMPLSVIRATIDVDAYVQDHSGNAVPWAPFEGIAWLTSPIDGIVATEIKAISHD